MIDITELQAMLVEAAVKYGQKILLAIVIYIIGSWIIGKMVSSLKALMDKRDVDASLRPFLSSVASVTLKIALFISIASVLGIEMTSFIAIIGTIGIGIGMALSGTLQNVAGGVVLLVLRPFNVGDFITAQGESGTVRAIGIFNTTLKTPDNKTIILPNGSLANGNITNFSAEETRRVDFVFGIGYGDDIDKAKAILKEVVETDERVLKDPAYVINVAALADSSVNLNCRVWAKAADYWGIYNDTLEIVKKRFDAEGVSIPFPQRDIHVYNEK